MNLFCFFVLYKVFCTYAEIRFYNQGGDVNVKCSSKYLYRVWLRPVDICLPATGLIGYNTTHVYSDYYLNPIENCTNSIQFLTIPKGVCTDEFVDDPLIASHIRVDIRSGRIGDYVSALDIRRMEYTYYEDRYCGKLLYRDIEYGDCLYFSHSRCVTDTSDGVWYSYDCHHGYCYDTSKMCCSCVEEENYLVAGDVYKGVTDSMFYVILMIFAVVGLILLCLLCCMSIMGVGVVKNAEGGGGGSNDNVGDKEFRRVQPQQQQPPQNVNEGVFGQDQQPQHPQGMGDGNEYRM